MSSPTRITLSRKRGWKMPPNTVCVARPSKWGNPYKIGDPHPGVGIPMNIHDVMILFQKHAETAFTAEDLSELRGKNLACWCKPDSLCHADFLLRLANRPTA